MLDYCPRNMIQVEEYVRTEKPTGKSVSEMSKNLILLTMLQNHENKTVEMVNFFLFKWKPYTPSVGEFLNEIDGPVHGRIELHSKHFS